MNPETVYRPRDQVVLAEMPDGTAILLNLETRLYYAINRTGLFVWKALSDQARPTVSALARQLASAFDVSIEEAERDASTFLRTVEEEQLVVS